jgi:hypothetical protein
MSKKKLIGTKVLPKVQKKIQKIIITKVIRKI